MPDDPTAPDGWRSTYSSPERAPDMPPYTAPQRMHLQILNDDNTSPRFPTDPCDA